MVGAGSYVPNRGDIVWISFNPQSGREQAGRRPGLVLSASDYNGTVGLALCCPITNQVKGYPFEVALPEGLDVSGVVLADHIKSLDWRERRAEFACKAPTAVLERALELLLRIL